MKKLQSCIAYALFESHLQYGIVAWGGTRAGHLQRICWFKKSSMLMTILIDLDTMKAAEKHSMYWLLNVMTVIYCTLFYVWEFLCCVLTEKIYKEAQTQVYTAILPYTRYSSGYHLPQHYSSLLCWFEKKPSYIGQKIFNLLPEEGRETTGDCPEQLDDNSPILLNGRTHQWRNTSIDLTSFEWALTIHS